VTDPGRATVTAANGLQGPYSNRAIADASGNVILSNPQPGENGNLGLRSIEGAGRIGFDLAMSKSVQIDENMDLQFRFDAINVLNRSNFGNPTLDINSSRFGRITSATGERSFVVNARVNF
jgi:hypothetical protein